MMHYKVIEGKKYGFPTYAIQRRCLSFTQEFKGELEFKDSITHLAWAGYLVRE